MTFNDLIDLKPSITLAELIQLFLLGYDDKIYVDILVNAEKIFENIRIIDSELIPYYEYKIEYLTDTCTGIMAIGLKKEVKISDIRRKDSFI